jgi:hypothetical protein
MFSKNSLLGFTAAVVMAGTLVAQSPAASAATLENGFGANAYGTELNVAGLVTSGRSALSSLGCTSQVGVTHTNSVASVGAPPLLTSGTVSTSATTQATATGVASTATSSIQDVSLLGGVVTVGALTSESTTSQNTTTGKFSVSSAGTHFASLTVLGLPILVQPGPNTEIALPGIGSVILNQQKSHVSKNAANLTVIAIHIDVTITTPLAKAGTQIVVSYASSSLGGPVGGLLSGNSFGAKANLAGLVNVGPLFPQPLGCFGTNGTVKTNAGAIVGVPGVDSGTISDTAEGVSNASGVSGEVTSTIEGLSLLGGLVTATAVKADVTANGNPGTFGDDSTFLDLVVAGVPVTVNPAPNTKIPLAGIGTLYLHRVITTANSIKVIMLQLKVTVPGNPLGLAVGLTVSVGYATIDVQ